MPGTRLDIGGLACWTAGSGPPLVLVHSVNAAASAAEVRPLFEDGLATNTVYAPDLPGFGSSPREPREYTPRLMTDAVLAVVRAVRERHGPAPLPALAVSLGSEFLARAASEQPGWFERIALVSPTGLDGTALR
ncbi:MAG: alpha/beta fold hydrolase, partial [Pseudomonadota bacterium]